MQGLALHHADGVANIVMIAYPIEGTYGFLFRNTSSLEAKISLLRSVEVIPDGWGELTEEKWGGPLPEVK